MEWAEGYAAGSDYTHGYYRQLNPLFVEVALAAAGIEAPRQGGAACELGFGQGLSLAMHAAAGGGWRWWGTDFMPQQAARARDLATAAELPAVLEEQSFAEFCARDDLPDFDFIGMHGIWSWVSAENRRIILDFVRRRLRPGGVLYVSYNTATGWASLSPLREFLVQHARRMSPAGLSDMGRIKAALPFIERAFGARSVYAGQNPLAPLMLQKMLGETETYLAHEYLGSHWEPMHFAEVADRMAEAKLSYAGIARLVEHVPELAGFAEQRALLAEIEDPVFREVTRDVLVGERFRQDLWVKGARRLSPAGRAAALRALRFVLIEPPSLVTEIRPQTSHGEITLPRGPFEPFLEILADHVPRRLDEIERRSGAPLQTVLDALLVLTHIGAVQPAHGSDAALDQARAGATRLNGVLLSRAPLEREGDYLANPLTGGATHVPRVQRLFLLAEREHGCASPDEQARAAWSWLQADAPAGAPVPDLVALEEEARAFAAGRRPVLRAMGVA